VRPARFDQGAGGGVFVSREIRLYRK
jgi:hypothetical protein